MTAGVAFSLGREAVSNASVYLWLCVTQRDTLSGESERQTQLAEASSLS